MKQKEPLRHSNDMTPNSASRLPAILKNGKPLTDSSAADDQRQPAEEEKPRKRVSFRLSDLRRQSLTGSLPDLNKASKKDVHDSSANLRQQIQIDRGRLPEGSTAFRAVMDELDTDTDTDSDSGRPASQELRRSWNEGGVVPASSRKLYSSGGQTFRSKAAAAIYSKIVCAPSLQKARKKCLAADATARIDDDVQDRGDADASGSEVGRSEVDRSLRRDARTNYLTAARSDNSPCSSPKEPRSRNTVRRSPSPSRRSSPLVSSKATNISVRKNVAEVRRLPKS